MMKTIRPWIAMAAFFALLPSARAEVHLKEVRWGFQHGNRVTVHPKFTKAEEWDQPPVGHAFITPRIVVTLVNHDAAPAEGVILRYAIKARVVNIKTPKDKGTWVAPIWVDRRRVPFLKPDQILDVLIDPTAEMRLSISMKEMFRAGFWPNALNIQVMVEPRQGEEMAQKVLEKNLPVVWQAPKQ